MLDALEPRLRRGRSRRVLACAADSRDELAAAVRRGHAGLWPGAQEPEPGLSPTAVIALTLLALRNNDAPALASGAATLRRFSTPTFQLAGMPSDPSPHELSALLRQPTCQYNLLLEGGYELSLPSDTVFADGDDGVARAFQEVQLDAVDDGPMLAKIGWELELWEPTRCWLTSSIAWQDFRDGFRPGIGREEWTRAYG